MADSSHHEHHHCQHCHTPSTCEHSRCALVECAQRCGQRMHACKQLDHDQLCPQALVACANRVNGCGQVLQRAQMLRHLSECAASVVQCGSYRWRHILPLRAELRNIERNSASSIVDPIEARRRGDQLKLAELARQDPVRFCRLYGHLIGNSSDSSSMRRLFAKFYKPVRSRLFDDIECDNCVVSNDAVGCAACQRRIRNLEESRFEHLCKTNWRHVCHLLANVYNFDSFVASGVHASDPFRRIYASLYDAPKQDADEDEEDDDEDEERKRRKLLECSRQIVEMCELSELVETNVSEQVTCEFFALRFEKYRRREDSFRVDCARLLRRDEFAQHYACEHDANAALPFDARCPYKLHGCHYFYSYDENNNENRVDEERTTTDSVTLMDLPVEILLRIADELDSVSVDALARTCKSMSRFCDQFLLPVRSIIYPVWKKERRENVVAVAAAADDDDAEKDSQESPRKASRWFVHKYVRTYSQHAGVSVEASSAEQHTAFLNHVQTCRFRRQRHSETQQRVRVYPPFDLESEQPNPKSASMTL